MRKAFTLAETMTVLVVLGVIASITIPQVVKRHVEVSNRTKIKKAIAVYDILLNKMVVENSIKSETALQDWANDDCSNTSGYFKISESIGEENSCKFRTSDGIYWDITDITNPIISLNEEDLNAESASDADNKKAFALLGEFDEEGILRVNDLQYEINTQNATEKARLEKLYGFLGVEIEEAKKSSYDDILSGKYNTLCPDRNSGTSCYRCVGLGICNIKDENGDTIGMYTGHTPLGSLLENNPDDLYYVEYTRDENGNITKLTVPGDKTVNGQKEIVVEYGKNYRFEGDFYSFSCNATECYGTSAAGN